MPDASCQDQSMRSYALRIVGKWNTRVLHHALAFSSWRFKRGDRANLPVAHDLRSGGCAAEAAGRSIVLGGTMGHLTVFDSCFYK